MVKKTFKVGDVVRVSIFDNKVFTICDKNDNGFYKVNNVWVTQEHIKLLFEDGELNDYAHYIYPEVLVENFYTGEITDVNKPYREAFLKGTDYIIKNL